MKLLFEPWSMGDALIAAWAADRGRREGGEPVALACASRWHSMLGAIYPELRLLAADVAYTAKNKPGLFKTIRALTPVSHDTGTAWSVRGDLRDFVACGKLFPGLSRRFDGWEAFVARRSRLADLPFSAGLLSVHNRYDRWTAALGLTPSERRPVAPSSPAKRVVLHLGAQWLSKRYPHFNELARALESSGCEVETVRGPGDAEAGVPSREVHGTAAVECLRRANLVICNDSGPMHLGFALGRPTVALFRHSGAEEWAPPGVLALHRKQFSGYRPRHVYASDLAAGPEDWFTADAIVARLRDLRWLG